ncbi:ABC-1 domain-containing protein [Caldicellulosiruptor obsidiansis OB47]|uniref:ABC-1 domain-containing protein n=1 Tax=Caldicellulosiruptor obsidiansis (strain ATCC BAA-2073 / JCM 16842 / OB47) TaxID=608506 RepID=D9TJT7_CALOO|nr:AarF/UbiB family protein [Caldicellulosiruptor obsidiansis]ADL42269.1 ABC-1 domain-containing protein [Caldicellulosiruptor obsidiansis OB47]
MPNTKRKRINRLRFIINVFVKHGFGYIFSSTPLVKFKRFSDNKANRGQRLKNALEELGTTFIKMGQLLANRPDLVPEDIIAELKNLQEKVKPFSFDEAKSILVRNDIFDKFEYIEKDPIATASIGQVHIGYLNGKKVAVKIRRPNVDYEVKTDIEILKRISAILDKYSPVRNIVSFSAIVNEVANVLLKEIDFRFEQNNIKKLKKALSAKEVIIPDIYEELCSEEVLITSFVEAKTLGTIEVEKIPLIERMKLGKKLVNLYLSQIFELGVFHADPHPGNILITDNFEIAFVDFGMVGYLSRQDRENLSNLLLGIVLNDKKRTLKAFKELGIIQKGIDANKFYNDIESIVNHYINQPISSIKVADVFNDVFKLTFRYKLKIPQQFVLFGRTLSLLENDIALLKVDLSILEAILPYVNRLVFKNRLSKLSVANLFNILSSYFSLLEFLPKKTETILEKLEEDELTVNIEIKNIEKILHQMERLANKVSLAVILLSVSIIIAGMTVGGLLSPALYKTILSAWYLWALRLGILILIILIIIMLVMIIRKEK